MHTVQANFEPYGPPDGGMLHFLSVLTNTGGGAEHIFNPTHCHWYVKPPAPLSSAATAPNKGYLHTLH